MSTKPPASSMTPSATVATPACSSSAAARPRTSCCKPSRKFRKSSASMGQITDARPDTGGLSGATPAEAVSWGKVDPKKLPDAVVCYVDSTVALPLITSYAIDKVKPRKPKRLIDHRDRIIQRVTRDYKGSQFYKKFLDR